MVTLLFFPNGGHRTDNEAAQIEIGANFAAPTDGAVRVAFRMPAAEADLAFCADAAEAPARPRGNVTVTVGSAVRA